MEKKSLFERLLYKYEYLGEVEKDGNVFKKYKKVKRFTGLQATLKIVQFTVLLIGLVALVHLFGSLLIPRK